VAMTPRATSSSPAVLRRRVSTGSAPACTTPTASPSPASSTSTATPADSRRCPRSRWTARAVS
jgi:hypothetical protein